MTRLEDPKRNPCARCGGILRRFRPKFISTNNPHPYWPKYVPQIKEICTNCDQYVRFALQTKELIEAFNKYFTENDVEVNEDV